MCGRKRNGALSHGVGGCVIRFGRAAERATAGEFLAAESNFPPRKMGKSKILEGSKSSSSCTSRSILPSVASDHRPLAVSATLCRPFYCSGFLSSPLTSSRRPRSPLFSTHFVRPSSGRHISHGLLPLFSTCFPSQQCRCFKFECFGQRSTSALRRSLHPRRFAVGWEGGG